MADSNITLSGLTLTPGFGQTFAKWTVTDPNVGGLSYLQLDKVELWSATANDRADGSFAKVAEGVFDAIHTVADGVARWYWVKARNKSGLYGDFYPSSPTAGVAAPATASIATNGYMRMPNGLIFQWGNDSVAGFNIISYPLTFPHAALNVVATIAGGIAFDRTISIWNTVSAGTFEVSVFDHTNTAQTESIFWQAWGY